jgi:hypothetical protein
MITQQLEVSILAAPLEAIDPRVLSQAWYSALRLAPQGRGTQPDRACPRRLVAVPSRAASPRPSGLSQRHVVETQSPRLVAVQTAPLLGDEEHPTVARSSFTRYALAQRIERAFSDPRVGPKRATFSIGRGSARVHVMLQTKGTRATLLALCRPELQAVVARALAQARLALTARGIGVAPDVKGDRRCFSVQA